MVVGCACGKSFAEISLLSVYIIALFYQIVAKANDDVQELYQAYGSGDFITISTGRPQPVREAPSIATVITATEIRAMGARDIDEVLETVPGLHVSRNAPGYTPNYIIRGIATRFNPQVLFAVNGIPITNSFVGDRGQIWGGLPIEAIARIEIIRGPGSATNGADAYAGVINIVTKNFDDIREKEVGLRIGSFSTKDTWAVLSTRWQGWDTALITEFGTTEGHKERIIADAQTYFDQLTGSAVSLAPGGVNTGVDRFDMRLELSKKKWKIRAGYQGRRNSESGAGLGSALDPVGTGKSDRINIDITYSDLEISPNWQFDAIVHYFDVNAVTDKTAVLFPPGTDFTLLGGGVFPEGVLARPDIYERHWRIGLDWLYIGLPNHTLRLGFGGQVDDLYRVEERKNYVLNMMGVPVPLGGLIDVTNSSPFTQEKKREVIYGLIQDEWKFIPDWTLTTGFRIDYYSDFGATINPRLAVVWNALRHTTLKILYGRAFRAPSFAEQFNINNPVAIGNPDLNPETIDTLEFGIDYAPTAELRVTGNIFTYRMRDLISINTISRKATNAGQIDGHGFEWDMRYKIDSKLSLSGNYAYQYTDNKNNDESPGNGPQHQAYAAIMYRPKLDLSLMAQIHWIGKRKRSPGDLRSTLDSYNTVNLNVQHTTKNNFSVGASVYNLFDQEAKEPSYDQTFIPYDLPLAGRAFMVELRHAF